MKRRFCLIYCVCSLVLVAQSAKQKEQTSSPRQLFMYKRVALQTPTFNDADNSRCDNDGNFYFKLDLEPFNNANVLKLSPLGDRAIVYTQPHEGKELTAYAAYAVSPDTTVFVLLETRLDERLEYRLLKFDSEGKVTSVVPLKIPVGVRPRSLAVLDDGTMFIAGEQDKSRVFRAVFSPTGQIRNILKDGMIQAKMEKSQTDLATFPQGDAVALGDEDFYALTSNKILVISKSGTVDRQIDLNKPKPDIIPMRLDVSGGYAAVELVRPEKGGVLNSTYLVLDLINRSTVGWYASPPEAGTALVCYTRQDGFIFSGVENGRLELRMAGLR